MSMLPRFAAMVWRTMVGTSRSLPSRSMIANGTKVMSATSFVMAMLKKKQRKTSVPISIQVFFTEDKSLCASRSKNPFCLNTFIITIRLQRIPSERQSMYEKYFSSGWTKNIETKAKIQATVRTASDLTNRITGLIIFDFADMVLEFRFRC